MAEKISFIKKVYCNAIDSEELLLVSQNMDSYKKSQETLDLINDFLFNKNLNQDNEPIDSRISEVYNSIKALHP